MTTDLMTIRLLIADDFAPLRHSLSQLIEVVDNVEIVGAARNGEEALRLCETLQPDMVLMDIDMPLLDGITATRRLKQRWPHIKVIGLTGFDDPDRIQDMLDAGASSCLTKVAPPVELLKLITTVAARL